MKKTATDLLRYMGFVAILFAMTCCGNIAFSQSLPSAKWKGVLTRSDGNEIVFNFETKDTLGKPLMYVLNANDRLTVDSIAQKGDSLFVVMPFFDSGFEIEIKNDSVWQGVWIKNPGKNQLTLPFHAYRGEPRFFVGSPPVADVTGRWASEFLVGERTIYRVGEFKQSGARVTGTFVSPAGDMRFLEGVVSGDTLKLSAFDGGYALSFTARVADEKTLSDGWLYSGFKGVQQWTAVRDANAKMPENPTNIVREAGKLNFRFRNAADGEWISINDERFRNKVVIISITGSWCPNCMDETKFLSEYYKKNRAKGIEVVGVAYELSEDFEEARRALKPFMTRFDVDYPVLITGVTADDTLRAEKTLPQIDKIRAFPTTLFVDKVGNIRKIHTGFDGPATGAHHERYKKEFDAIVTELLNED